MLISMTGFGSSNFEDAKLSINVELKSFNSRYFELNTKSFDLSGPFEYKIRDFLKKKLMKIGSQLQKSFHPIVVK